MPELTPPVLLVLPEFIQTKNQVLSLLSEILQIEEFLGKAQQRTAGAKLTLPKTTADLDKFAIANQRNVLNHTHRSELAHFLKEVYKRAPVVNVVLPLQASNEVTQKIIMWFRTNVHAQTLVLQSVHGRLVGGAIIRINHKTYNFSLAGRFEGANSALKEGINMLKPPVKTLGSSSRANYL